MVGLALLTVVGLLTLTGFDLAGRDNLDAWDAVAFIVLALMSMVVRELGHGYAINRFDRSGTRFGTALLRHRMPGELARDHRRLANKRQKLLVDLSGIYVTALLAAIFLILYNAVPSDAPCRDVLGYILLVNVVATICNLPPYLTVDGYRAVTDYLDVPDLQEQASLYFRKIVESWMGAGDPPSDTPPRIRLFRWYAVGGLLFAPWLFYDFWLTGLFPWLVGRLRSVGLILGLMFTAKILACMLTPVTPVAKGVWVHRRRLLEPRRLAVVASSGAAVVALLCWPLSHSVTGELTIEPVRRTPLRVVHPGMISRVIVREGKQVETGDPIVVVDGRELRAPADGIIVGPYQVGQWLEAGGTVVEIHDLSQVRARIRLDRSEPRIDLKPGRRAMLRLRSHPHRSLRTEVAALILDDDERHPMRLLTRPFAPGPRVFGGMTGRARVYGPDRSLTYQWFVVPVIQLLAIEGLGDLYDSIGGRAR